MALTKVSTDGVKDDAITSGKIPANAVGASELADNAVDTNAIANNAVTAGKTSGVQTTINNNADNRVITGSGTANTLNGEAALSFDGTTLKVSGASNSTQAVFAGTGGSGSRGLAITTESVGAADEGVILNAQASGTSGRLKFNTNGQTAMTILGNGGNVGIGTTSPSTLLELSGGGNTVLTINTGNNSGDNSQIAFGDSADADVGFINYDHGTHIMQFAVAASERMRIDSSGRMLIGTTTEGVSGADELTVATSGDTGISIRSGSSNSGKIFFSDATTGAGEYTGGFEYAHSDNSMRFFTNDGAERMRLGSDGSVYIGTTSGGNTGSYFQNDNNSRKTLNIGSSSSSAQNQIIFRNSNDRVGSIQTSGTSTSYNTTFSDIASKKNFENWTEDVLSLFKNINPQKFNFKVEDDSASKSKGFIAQEMVDKFPEAYVKQEEEMYMFNPSGMVVYLMKALQEAVVKIEVLETKVAALEAA